MGQQLPKTTLPKLNTGILLSRLIVSEAARSTMEVPLEVLLHGVKALEDIGCQQNYRGVTVKIDKNILLDMELELEKSKKNPGIADQLRLYLNGNVVDLR